MKLRIISDIHLEFSDGVYDLPILEDEENQTLIIAGDLAPITKNMMGGFLDESCSRFKNVIMIAGNHEYYYKGSIINQDVYFDQFMEKYDNFHFLQNEILMIDDVIVLGCTLWTNFNDHDHGIMARAQYQMNDFVHIRYNKKLFSTSNWLGENMISRVFLWDSLETFKDDSRKKIVITHHLPSKSSIGESFYYTRGEEYIYNYCSDDMAEWLKMTDLHIHGHVHNSVDYVEEGCRVVSNPRGYLHHEENADFDPKLVIEI